MGCAVRQWEEAFMLGEWEWVSVHRTLETTGNVMWVCVCFLLVRTRAVLLRTALRMALETLPCVMYIKNERVACLLRAHDMWLF